MLVCLLLHICKVEVLLLQLFQVLFQCLPVWLVREPVLDIDLVEKRYHVVCLIFIVVYFLYSVEDYDHDDLVWHYARFVQERVVALLDA
jgi:hypothetical protein